MIDRIEQAKIDHDREHDLEKAARVKVEFDITDYLDAKFQAIDKNFDRMEQRYDKVLYGNGQRGLIREVESLRTAKDNNRKWDVGAIATAVVSFLTALIAYLQ